MVAGNKNRKNPRAHVSLVARYRSPTAFEFVEEECVDLSSGGMFIKSKAPAPAGTLLKLECDLDHGLRVMRAVARVVWVREREGGDEPRGMGVKFVKLDPGGREMIDQVLQRLGGDEGAGPQARSSNPPANEAALLAQASSLRPGIMSAARVAPAAALTTALIEAKPPNAPVSVPAPPAGAAPNKDTRSSSPRTSNKPKAKATKSDAPRQSPKAQAAKADGQRRSSAAPRSDVPTHRPPARTAPDARSIAIGIGLLIGVALIAILTRRPAQAPSEVASVESVRTPSETAQSFVMHLTTLPNGAHVTVGEHAGTSPMSLDLGTLSDAIEVRAEKDGYEPVTSSIELARFVEEKGKRVAKVMLALPPLPREATTEQTNVNTLAKAPAEPEPARPGAATAAPEKPRESASAKSATKRSAPSAPADKPVHASAEQAPAPKPAALPAAPATPEPSPPVPSPTAASPSAPVATSSVATSPVATAPSANAPSTPAAAASAAPAPAPAPLPAVYAAPAPMTGSLTPMQAARACLAQNDKACAISALEGRARTAQEIELLVETYRGMGRTADVERNMRLYVQRYPNERRAAAYSSQLGLPAGQ